MRRKSERTSKKTKSSPEKKVEKSKRTRTSRRKKPSSSSENESAGESGAPVPSVEPKEQIEKKSPIKQPVAKEESPEEKQDQVWQVKTAEGSGDSGEIQKLKICLARPPSTPERLDKSPRSKRKHSRTTSSSDSPSVETPEDKKKGKHRSKRSNRESKDDLDKNQDSQGDEPDTEQAEEVQQVKQTKEVTQSVDTSTNDDNVPMSTTCDESQSDDKVNKESSVQEKGNDESEAVVGNSDKSTPADTTVHSSFVESQNSQIEINTSTGHSTDNERSPSAERTDSAMKSSIVIPERASESNGDKSDVEHDNTQTAEVSKDIQEEKSKLDDSNIQENNVSNDTLTKDVTEETASRANEEAVVETSGEKVAAVVAVSEAEHCSNSPQERNRQYSIDSTMERDTDETRESYSSKDYGRSDHTQSKEDTTHNGQVAPLVIHRKRKWGSRITTQKSITISTDVLKDIIPDVKPVEFDEVMEQKKKGRKEVERVERIERVERPILPKIVIDNTDYVDYKKREDRIEEDIKNKESLPLSNRKISIIKEGDSVVGRPPSPPKHKSSCILFISNLVRPFTLPQLKNLLQRTGRIVEDGFWIDRIKSKCYIKYETEDQAVETRHALHGVTWPVSNPKALHVDFSSQEAFDNAKTSEENSETPISTIPGTVEDWLREQDQKRERGEVVQEKPWERKNAVREWDVGKGDKGKEGLIRPDDRSLDKRRHRTPERSPEPAKKFKKKEEEAPAKLLDDLFRKTKTTPCIYWLPLSAETIAVKEEQRRQHMAEHERRMQEMRRHRRH